MKRMLPVTELAHDDRFAHMAIEERCSTPGTCRRAAQRNTLAPTYENSTDNARGLMHGIFVGEIQALEGAGRTCFDFDLGEGRDQAPLGLKLDMARQCWDEARHVEISIELGQHMGSEIGEFAEQTLLYEAACNPDPVLRLTGVNRALGVWPSTCSSPSATSVRCCRDPVLEFCRGLDARRRGDPREDGQRLVTPFDRPGSRSVKKKRSISRRRSTSCSVSVASVVNATRTRCTWPATSAGWPASPTRRSANWSTSPRSGRLKRSRSRPTRSNWPHRADPTDRRGVLNANLQGTALKWLLRRMQLWSP